MASDAPRSQRAFPDRLIGALKLDASVYEEVEHDPQALGQAAGVVAIGAVAEGLAAMGVGGHWGPLLGVIAGLLGWLVSAGIVWLIGVRFMHHSSDYPELLRTLGFASAPKILLVLALVPVLGGLVRLGVFGLTLAAFVVAVRQALDVPTERAVLVCVLAVGVSVLLAFLGVRV